MKRILPIYLLGILMCSPAFFSLHAQNFTSGATVLDAVLSGREWHITSKKDGNPDVSEWNGGVAAVGGLPLDGHRSFIIEDGPDDGDGWTPDVRWFHIRNRFNDLYLTVDNPSAGSTLSWQSYRGNELAGMFSQQFRLIAYELGWYKLRSRLSQTGQDLVLTVSPNGQLTVEHPDAGASADQKFAFNLSIPLEPTYRYLILGINNNDMISDRGISSENAEVVHVEATDYSCIWTFQDAGEGYHYIINALTGNYLSNNGSTSAGDPLYTNQNPSDNAKWKLIRNEHTFRFENKVSGYQIGTKGQTANNKPLFQEPSAGIGVKWALLAYTEEDPALVQGDYHHILDGAAPFNDCMVFGPTFMMALGERAGLTPDASWFPLIEDAMKYYYQDSITALQALQNFDLHDLGHRAELAFALRNHILINLARKAPVLRTQAENDAVAYFEAKIQAIRWAYADALYDKAVEFETSFGLGNGGPVLFSDLLDNLNASDFVWPGDYEPSTYQQGIMEHYSSACKTMDLKNPHQEMGLRVAILVEPVIIPGLAVALNMGTRAAFAALAPALDYTTMTASVIHEAQATLRATLAMASQAGNIATVALIAAQIIAMEAMEAQEVTRLGQRIIDRINWGHSQVSMYAVLSGSNELAKLRLLGDMDFVVGAPLTGDFQHYFNDNYSFVPFSLSCVNALQVDLDGNGQATVTPFQLAQPMIVTCGGELQFDLSVSQFDCSKLGNQQVNLTAHNNALSETCTVSVYVQDHIAPVLQCKNATIYLDAGGTAALSYPQVFQSGTDNCGQVNTQSISQTVFGCSHIGVNTVQLTANDGHGNTATCNASVTVVDQMPPQVECKNTTIYLDANGQGQVQSSEVFKTGSDNCGVVNLGAVSPNTFDCSKIGTNTSTLTVNDGHNNLASCTATITVVDAIAPSVVCKNTTINLDSLGNTSISTAQVFQSALDNCGQVIQQSVTPGTFSCSNLGQNLVTLTVHDGHGNTNTCTSTVTVKDVTAPKLRCKNATLSLNASGQATLSVAQINNGSSDNCGITQMGLSQMQFTCAHVGNNTVILGGNDQSMNIGQCSATVTVLDAILPIAKCKNTVTNLAANGSVTVLPAAVDNGSSDNCSFSMTLSPNTFNCGQIGQQSVTLRATDASGNSKTCSATVTVRDVNAPTALCKNATIFLNDAGVVTLSPNQVNNGSSDACGITTMSLSKTQFNCGDLSGSQTVTLSLSDVNGNQSSCNAQITIKDNLAPTAICQNVTMNLGANGTLTVFSADLADNSYDNCSIWKYEPTAKVYTTANIGNNNLNINVKDGSGNQSSCTAVVKVLPYNGLRPEVERGPEMTTPEFNLNLFPNPAGSASTLSFQLPAEQRFVVRVFDPSGREVYHQSALGMAGENLLNLELTGLASGVYLLDFESDALRTQKRLVIQR